MPKQRPALRIDKTPPIKFGGVQEESTEDLAPPALPSIPAPEDLALATTIGYSSAAPSAIISATWSIPPGVEPQRYVVQVSESNTFPDATTITVTAAQASAAIDGLKPATLYYVRVAAQYYGIQSDWSSTASITSASDTTAAGVPSSQASVFIGTGDLLLTWTNPTQANFKDVEVKVYASNGGALLRTAYAAGGQFLYTVAMNLADTSGVGDPSLYVELKSRTFSNVLSTAATASATKSAPSAPTLSHSWTGDTGAAGADLVLSWTAITDAAKYRLTLNGGTARDLSVTTFTYTLEANRAQNTTADPSITYSLVAVDGLLQSSPAASGTATNAAPPTPTVALTAGAIAGVTATVGGTKAADFAAYEYVFKRESTTVLTVESPASSVTYDMSAAGDAGYHSWTCVVRQKDAFAQYSGTVTSSAVAFEALTLTYLRDGIVYSDSPGTAAATLKTAMADGDTTSGGVSYAA